MSAKFKVTIRLDWAGRRGVPTGQLRLSEVLRGVHGVSNEQLREPAYTVALGEVQVQVPGPMALLQAKIATVADIAQAGRRDARHVLILAQLLPAYLRDLQRTAIAGGMTERQFIDTLERSLGVVASAKARKVLIGLRVEPASWFAGLGNEELPKLARFLARRLPRVLRRIVKPVP